MIPSKKLKCDPFRSQAFAWEFDLDSVHFSRAAERLHGCAWAVGEHTPCTSRLRVPELDTCRLRQQRFILPQFWRLEASGQGLPGLGFW